MGHADDRLAYLDRAANLATRLNTNGYRVGGTTQDKLKDRRAGKVKYSK